MNIDNVLSSKVVKLYGNRVLFNDRKLIIDNHEKVYQEGRLAASNGAGSNENPYNKDDNYLWSKFDVWLEGYLSESKESYND